MERQHILLVDDAADTRSFLAGSILEPEGYTVTTAASGEEALALLNDFQPALIISDYLMPGLTGLDLLQTIQAQGKNIPFILITAEGSEFLAIRALRLGVRDYLTKPFAIDDLLHAIQTVIQLPPPTQQESPFWNIRTILLVLDAENRLLFYNHAAVEWLSIPANTPSGAALAEVMQQPEILTLCQEAESRRCEVALSDRTFNTEVTILPDHKRVIVMQEVTHFKEMDRIKSDFVATVAHDLRSPLTTILGYTDLIGRSGELNDPQKKFIEHIVFSVKSITALLSDLLDLSKIEAGFDNNLEPTRMDMIIRYALEAIHSEADTKKQHINVQIAPHLPQVMGNPIRLKQVVANLLQNAIKYTPENGQIEVRLYGDDGFIVFQVQDNGIGISLEEQPYIFDKFYRTNEASDHYPGTGLGLSIVKTIVDAHSGRIWVESTPGQGSTFTVMLVGKKDG